MDYWILILQLYGTFFVIGLMFTISGDRISILAENFPDRKSWVVFAAAMVVSLFTKAGPISR